MTMNEFESKILRYALATIWLVTAALSFGLYPLESSLLLVEGLHLPRNAAVLVVYAGALMDLVMGALTLAWPVRRLWSLQIAVIITYSALATVLVPEYWLHPFGPLLKNLAVLALLWLLYRHAGRGEPIA
jgi:hypothetical protein